MPLLLKPQTPLWQPASAPSGCKLYLPMCEGSGATTRDLANSYNGSFIGLPTWQPWQRGLYGPQIGGFSSSNYVSIDPPTQILYSGVYPCWIAILASSTSGGGHVFSQASTAGSNGTAFLAWDAGGTGKAGYIFRNDAGTGVAIFSAVALNDGIPRVLMGVSYGPTDHHFFVNGVQVASSVINISGAFTSNTLTVGGSRRSSIAGAATTSQAVVALAGNGSVPDPLALATDLLTGRFTAVRPRSRLAVLAAATQGGPSFQAAWALASNTILAGVS